MDLVADVTPYASVLTLFGIGRYHTLPYCLRKSPRHVIAFAQVLVNGLAVGCIYGLVALGFVLIYKATETVNFAQGELMMIGGFIGLTMTVHFSWPLWLTLVATALVTGALGMLLDRAVFRRVLGERQFTVIMLTIGVALVARGVVTMVPGWGTDTHALKTPWSGDVARLGVIAISADHVAIIVVTVLLCIALYGFFRLTRYGVAMQAASQNQLAATLMGIPVARLNTYIWGISAAIAAIAGLLYAPISFVHSNMGIIGLKAFPAAVVGGFGSVPGALAGGLIIGIVEALAGFYLPEGFKDIAAYVVVLVVLMVWPSGLFGERFTKRV